MAGFETIVRPVVFPAIRPAPARLLAPEDDPEKGIATLSGAGGKMIDLAFSETSSWSKSHPVEVKRRVDVQRVYQKEKPERDRKRNEDNYIDVEYATKIWMREGSQVEKKFNYARPDYLAPDKYNVEVLEKDKMITNPNLLPPLPIPPDEA